MNALLRSIRSLTLLLFLVVMARASFGQGITGSITGTVTDTRGAPIAGATVAIRQVGTDATRTILTSDVGSYRITQLAPGGYSIRIDKDGFKPFQQANVTLAIDNDAEIHAKLDKG